MFSVEIRCKEVYVSYEFEGPSGEERDFGRIQGYSREFYTLDGHYIFAYKREEPQSSKTIKLVKKNEHVNHV